MNALATIAQACALTFAVWLTLRLFRGRVNAATRHNVWWIALAAVVFLTCLPGRDSAAPAAPPPTARPAQSALPAVVAPPFTPVAEPAFVTISTPRAPWWPVAALAMWAAFFLFRSVQIARSFLQLRRMKRHATIWTGRQPRVLLSRAISSPVAAGFLHPAIVLPEDLPQRLTSEELNCILLHEAAHLARYDHWWNLLARCVNAVIGLHPAVWFILRQIECEREINCDDRVVAQTGAARVYAESLSRIAELRLAASRSVLATGIHTRRSRLYRRIEMLLARGRDFSTAAARGPLAIAATMLVLLAAAAALTPRWIVFAQTPQFEVASVKLNTTNGRPDFEPRRSGDLIIMHNTRVGSMIDYAYKLTGDYQLANSDKFPEYWKWYDLDARAGKGATDDQIRLMFQSLLADRFKLKIHRETREIPEYELKIAGKKPKLTPSSEPPKTVTIEGLSFSERPGKCSITLWVEGAHLVCHAATMEALTASLSNSLRSPVVDQTGLQGTYDVNVLFHHDNRRTDAADEAPPLPEAIQQELGLKLEKGKGPVEVIVVDHMEAPSAN